MKPIVYWFNNCRGSWCHAIIDWLTADCEHAKGLTKMDPDNPAVVVIKADDPLLKPDTLNGWLRPFPSVLLIVTANEDGSFDPSLIEHSRMRMWIQTPHRSQVQWCSAALPWGWTPGFDGTRWQSHVPGFENKEGTRWLDYSFAGQITHRRRQECARALELIHPDLKGAVVLTHSFSNGLPRHLYFELLLCTKIVPCPSGPVTVDTFRACEALECGCIPILDAYPPDILDGPCRDYWNFVFGPDHPLPVIADWRDIGSVVSKLSTAFETAQPKVIEWWSRRKQYWQDKFKTDLEMLRVNG
jgi:hypothetical protein